MDSSALLITNLVVSALAGIVTALISEPFWVITTRLQTQTNHQNSTNNNEREAQSSTHYNGVLHALWTIFLSEGLPGLYGGIGISLLMIGNPMLGYGLNGYFNALFFERLLESGVPSEIIIFIVGALTKGMGTIVSYPLASMLPKMQKMGNKPGAKKVTVCDLFAEIRDKEGYSGFWKGLGGKMGQSVTNNGLLLVFTNIISRWLKMLLDLPDDDGRRLSEDASEHRDLDASLLALMLSGLDGEGCEDG